MPQSKLTDFSPLDKNDQAGFDASLRRRKANCKR